MLALGAPIQRETDGYAVVSRHELSLAGHEELKSGIVSISFAVAYRRAVMHAPELSHPLLEPAVVFMCMFFAL